MIQRSPFVFDWVSEHAQARPDAPAIGTPTGWISYRELDRATRLLGGELAAAGVVPGSFVLLALPPSAAAVAAVLAVQTLGACAVEINRELDARSIASILDQTGARHAFIHGRGAASWAEIARTRGLEHLHVVFPSSPTTRMQQILDGLAWTWVHEDRPVGEVAALDDAPSFLEWMKETGATASLSLRSAAGSERTPKHARATASIPPHIGAGSERPSGDDARSGASANSPLHAAMDSGLDPHAPALLVYTSGSTGTPRGVLQTHANVHANTLAIATYLELTSDDRALSTLPLFYCYGRSILQTHLFVGGSVFFDHRFMYPRVVMEALGAQGCTGFYGVPLTFESLRRQVDVCALPLHTLRYVAQAGGAMHPDTIKWARDAFAPARLFVMYGQTEATARLSFLPPAYAEEKAGSIGRGLHNVELRVVDPSGHELPPREVGELVARGPNVTSGYFRAPEETSEILRGGWLWTGDLCWRDEDGFIFLVGRSKDMLKLGGHRVSAAEIEQIVVEHPDILEAAVIGAPDPTGGEAAIAFVVVAGDHEPDPAEVRRFCRERMPAFKIPREIRVVKALPRTSSGKVAKTELRKALEREI